MTYDLIVTREPDGRVEKWETYPSLTLAEYWHGRVLEDRAFGVREARIVDSNGLPPIESVRPRILTPEQAEAEGFGTLSAKIVP